MRLADGSDLRYEDPTPEEVAGTFNRVGKLIEILGELGIRCDQIYNQTELAIDRYYDLKNGVIAKDSISGKFMKADVAR